MVKLVAAGATAEKQALPPLRYAGIAGRQLHLLASDLPLPRDRRVGCYQALGEEKQALVAPGIELVSRAGFDVLKPAAVIFEHCAHGPFAQLAVTHGLRGPMFVLEGGAASTAHAVAAAARDLGRGRCDAALVGGFTIEPARAWLLLLEAGGELALRWRPASTRREPPPDDPLGLAALIAALRGARDATISLGRAVVEIRSGRAW